MNKKQGIKFTKRKLAALVPKDKEYFVYDEAGYGLRLRIGSTGTKTFQVLKRISGKMKVVTIDKFCNASGAMRIHPEEAQRRARLIYSQLSDGVNVTKEKRRLKAEEANEKAQHWGYLSKIDTVTEHGTTLRPMQKY